LQTHVITDLGAGDDEIDDCVDSDRLFVFFWTSGIIVTLGDDLKNLAYSMLETCHVWITISHIKLDLIDILEIQSHGTFARLFVIHIAYPM
jgi:hypothetical protein